MLFWKTTGNHAQTLWHANRIGGKMFKVIMIGRYYHLHPGTPCSDIPSKCITSSNFINFSSLFYRLRTVIPPMSELTCIWSHSLVELHFAASFIYISWMTQSIVFLLLDIPKCLALSVTQGGARRQLCMQHSKYSEPVLHASIKY